MSLLVKADAVVEVTPAGIQPKRTEKRAISPDVAQTHQLPADEDMLVAAAKQDRLLFGELYHRYVGRVYKYIYARVGDTHDAQDLTSQTFLAALQDIERYRGRGQFAGWLFAIAHYRIADHFRGSRQTLSLDMADELPHPGPSPDGLAEHQLQMEQVAQALRTLAPDRAEALTLRVFAELSTSEIARVMGKSETAIRMLVSRAMSDLKARLDYMTQS